MARKRKKLHNSFNMTRLNSVDITQMTQYEKTKWTPDIQSVARPHRKHTHNIRTHTHNVTEKQPFKQC